MVIGHDAQGRLTNYGTVGWIAAGATLLCIGWAGRVRPATDPGR
jgi:hypothetical protein